MRLLTRKTKTTQPASQPVRQPREPKPTRANNWNRRHSIGDTVLLHTGETFRIGGMDHERYNGWASGSTELTSITNADIRGRN